MSELTQTEQQMHEKAADFINRWRKIGLHRPQPITESECLHVHEQPSTGHGGISTRCTAHHFGRACFQYLELS